MGAARIEKARLAGEIAEQDQVLAEPADQLGQVRGVRRQGDRLPVPPQQLPALAAGPDQGQDRIEVRLLHAVGSARGVEQLGVHRVSPVVVVIG